jgi:prepilin signal peptidase PulO-like enzyme (type II secretory pathway)
MNKDHSSKPHKGRKNPTNSAMRHMGLAMTMAGLIGLGAWLGSLWDDWGDHEVAWATVLGAMLGLTLSLVAVFQDSER